MKVNKENNRLMIKASVLTIILTLLLTVIRITETRLDIKSDYVLRITVETGYILSLVYLANILQFIGEKTSLQTPFYMYIALDILKFILSMGPLSGLTLPDFNLYMMGIGLLNFFFTLYLIICVFKVKHTVLAPPFRVLGFSLLATMLIKFGLPFILISLPVRSPVIYFGFIDCIPLLGIYYVIRKTGDFINTTDVMEPITYSL